jgi:hypothetical protein
MSFFQYETLDPIRVSIYVVGFGIQKIWWNKALGHLLGLGLIFLQFFYASIGVFNDF